jgi:tetratricopeptide (TPR) repeat protein
MGDVEKAIIHYEKAIE